MRKIDLHIHTVPTSSDSTFDFCVDKLKSYVGLAGIDAIAITNHNIFDLDQYNYISAELEGKVVFPGIEVDVDTCHILVISPTENISNFVVAADTIYKARESTGESLPVDKFVQVLGDIDKYLIIPHFQKNPSIAANTYEYLEKWVFSGEVNSAKKFIKCCKDPNSLTPVIFSDVRIKPELNNFPVRQTYIDCGELTIPAIKACLRDKDKVFLSESDGNHLMQVLDNGLMISTGLNVLLGKRSSGKTFTLDSINSETKRVKYIKQFSLVQGSSKDHEIKFNNNIASQRNSISEDYLSGFRSVLDEVKNIDTNALDQQVHDYIASLKRNASETHLQDIYSKATLFSEVTYSAPDNKGLVELIQSTQHLIENLDYRDQIEKHVDIGELKILACELIELLWEKTDQASAQVTVNGLISNIKSALVVRSSASHIDDVDLFEHTLDKDRINRFNEIVGYLREEKTIVEYDIQGYKVIGRKRRYEQTSEIKSVIAGNPALSEAMKVYENPYLFLQALLGIENLDNADIYKCFVSIQYQVHNSEGMPVSGGERSEFRLLQEIQDATKSDVLLIDEPESSFDNSFLKANVNELIRDISKNMPVVVVTHNSTVGGSINPDYLLYAAKENHNDQIVHKVYQGFPTDKVLSCFDGTSIDTHEVYLDSLEAGEEAYKDRRGTYETVKN